MNKMKFIIVFGIMILIFLTSVSNTNATLVASFTIDNGGGFSPHSGNVNDYSNAKIWLTFDDDISDLTPADEPLAPASISTSIIPSTFVWTNSDPGFSDAVTWMTNGFDDFIGVRFSHDFYPSFTSTSLRQESSAYASSPGFTDPDLLGSQIDSISIEVTQYYNEIGSGGTLDHYLTCNITVDGNPIPEPATMLLLGSGLVGLAGFRKRFRKK